MVVNRLVFLKDISPLFRSYCQLTAFLKTQHALFERLYQITIFLSNQTDILLSFGYENIYLHKSCLRLIKKHLHSNVMRPVTK